ncbi:hypothetical protein F511_32036 [Dorcoceras hygrometricum]|uniref:Uncharacterized protein n=1 Tax=Dorcoceras hygrometricum TaxID=472368 RepID=A0A2Z7CLR7_9LAMI|nr:hypothetical protein F511_32036 [Dorcoceras hygrometricum]
MTCPSEREVLGAMSFGTFQIWLLGTAVVVIVARYQGTNVSLFYNVEFGMGIMCAAVYDFVLSLLAFVMLLLQAITLHTRIIHAELRSCLAVPCCLSDLSGDAMSFSDSDVDSGMTCPSERAVLGVTSFGFWRAGEDHRRSFLVYPVSISAI